MKKKQMTLALLVTVGNKISLIKLLSSFCVSLNDKEISNTFLYMVIWLR